MNYSRCDVHTHTLYSRHAYSTIAENIHEAAKNGLELLRVRITLVPCCMVNPTTYETSSIF